MIFKSVHFPDKEFSTKEELFSTLKRKTYLLLKTKRKEKYMNLIKKVSLLI